MKATATKLLAGITVLCIEEEPKRFDLVVIGAGGHAVYKPCAEATVAIISMDRPDYEQVLKTLKCSIPVILMAPRGFWSMDRLCSLVGGPFTHICFGRPEKYDDLVEPIRAAHQQLVDCRKPAISTA